MGDKVEARKAAQKAGVPLVPGLQEDVSAERLVAAAREVGYPVMLKAAAGGGGPRNSTPACLQASARSSFSLRKP
ncbi:MAG: hypothetical protein ACK56S_16615 [Planctomycetota bacterium]